MDKIQLLRLPQSFGGAQEILDLGLGFASWREHKLFLPAPCSTILVSRQDAKTQRG